MCVAAIAAGLALGLYTAKQQQSGQQQISGFVFPKPEPLSDIKLIGQDKLDLTTDSFKGHWTFVYVGYTFCPDACPITLTTMNQTYELLGDTVDSAPARMMLVSVDPQRDTPERLEEYVKYFNPSFIGATGTDDNLRHFANQTRSLYSLPEDRSDGEYLVDHSSSIILINPDAAVHAIFTPPQAADAMAADFDAILQAY